MEKHIRKILLRMSIVVGALVVLVVWQHDFIWHGIKHNIWVNSAIFLTIIAGAIIAYANVLKLKNEIVAFEALQEMWTDARDGPDKAAVDPFWRHYRCMTPGILFQPPKILGHVYDLVTEEIARTKKFSISIETMQTLIHKIDAKLSEEKSLLSYMAGLLVFMGLIGTFMGLLRMVGSIGGILSGLQTMSGGDSTGAEAFGQLLGQLQEPLAGMATGFASSLFGLFGSLVVGLLGRYAHQAASQLKVEFESWLAAVAQIDNAGSGGTALSSGGGLDNVKLTRLIAEITSGNSRAARGFDTMAALLTRLTEQQDAALKAMEEIGRGVADVAAAQTTLGTTLGAGLTEVRALPTLFGELGHEVRAGTDRLAHHVDSGLRVLTETGDGLRHVLSLGQTDLIGQLSAHQSDILHKISGEMGRVADQVGRERAAAHGISEARMAEMVAELRRIAASDGRAAPDISRLEAVLADGLTEISRGMEAAFSAFAQVSRMTTREDEEESALFADDYMRSATPQAPTLPAGAFAEALTKRNHSGR